jgi:four helix bundle protein
MLYEKLEVWQRSKDLAITVYRELANCRDFGFKDQITRSILSVPSNIAEGCERSSNIEKSRFLDIAKGSIGEFKTQSIIGIEIQYINKLKGKCWLDESEELSKMIASLTRKLRDQ